MGNRQTALEWHERFPDRAPVPPEAVGCSLYEAVSGRKGMLDRARKLGKPLCMYHSRSDRWYVAKQPWTKIRRVREPRRNVLVLCQRPINNDDAGNFKQLDRGVSTVESALSEVLPGPAPRVEYMSPSIQGGVDVPGYRFQFDTGTGETDAFIQAHRGRYDLIVLYTCPVPWVFTPSNIRGFREILRPHGKIMLLSPVTGHAGLVRHYATPALAGAGPAAEFQLAEDTLLDLGFRDVNGEYWEMNDGNSSSLS